MKRLKEIMIWSESGLQGTTYKTCVCSSSGFLNAKAWCQRVWFGSIISHASAASKPKIISCQYSCQQFLSVTLNFRNLHYLKDSCVPGSSLQGESAGELVLLVPGIGEVSDWQERSLGTQLLPSSEWPGPDQLAFCFIQASLLGPFAAWSGNSEVPLPN